MDVPENFSAVQFQQMLLKFFHATFLSCRKNRHTEGEIIKRERKRERERVCLTILFLGVTKFCLERYFNGFDFEGRVYIRGGQSAAR